MKHVNDMNVGVSSTSATLRRVAMRRPGALLSADHERWHYVKPVNADALSKQYDRFVELVEATGTEIVWFPETDDDLADSVFTYDPSFVVPGGAVVLRPGKPLRAGEADLHAAFYGGEGIPILGRIEAPGTFEGGDCFWLDNTTLAVGRGFRTNQLGINQMASAIKIASSTRKRVGLRATSVTPPITRPSSTTDAVQLEKGSGEVLIKIRVPALTA